MERHHDAIHVHGIFILQKERVGGMSLMGVHRSLNARWPPCRGNGRNILKSDAHLWSRPVNFWSVRLATEVQRLFVGVK